ncbi:hypothetical protein J4Q44_G00205140 [Coregonus suidteri]|uniref:Osteoclast-stimulating factor 1 n=1 Tax=Coregonus suidteri TaxID=861788 RepID=A0AAN8QRS7_9TELE
MCVPPACQGEGADGTLLQKLSAAVWAHKKTLQLELGSSIHLLRGKCLIAASSLKTSTQTEEQATTASSKIKGQSTRWSTLGAGGISVKSSRYAYRRVFNKFLQRLPSDGGDVAVLAGGRAARVLISSARSNRTQTSTRWDVPRSSSKAPERLFLLEEMRERKFDTFARTIQKAWRKYIARRKYEQMREDASDILYNSKERRRNSINRNFVGDYLGLEQRPELRQFLAKRERIDFADSVNKFDRRFKSIKRDLILSPKGIYLIGREKVKKGPEKGQIKEVLKRKLEFESIHSVSLSMRQDDFFIVHETQYDSLLESNFKTEFLSLLCKRYEEVTKNKLPLSFNDRLEFRVKKEGWGGGGTRVVVFQKGQGDLAEIRPAGKTLTITVGDGLPKTSKPTKKGALQIRAGGRSQPPSRGSQNGAPRGRGAPPPQQSEHTYTSQKQNRPPSAALPKLGSQNTRRGAAQTQTQQGNLDFLNVPDQGVSGMQRKRSISSQRPPPAPSSRPKAKPRPMGPRCRALYQYAGQDTDELSFDVNDVIDLLNEDASGWWRGRFRGKEGLFPGNYVEKI